MSYNPRTVQAVRDLIVRDAKAAPEPAADKPAPPPNPHAQQARTALAETRETA